MQLIKDRFSKDAPRGRVVGRNGDDGVSRAGVDRENVFSVDNNALRIQPLIDPGWNKAVISYGPFPRQPGLVMSVFMVNGHNTSQAEPVPEGFRNRLSNWIYGSRAFGGRRERIQRLIRSGGRIARVLRQIRLWRRLSTREVPPLDENLAVGWFPEEVSNPMNAGAAFVMHATGHECGELWVREAQNLAPVVRSMQNLQVYYVVALRESDAVYYVSSVPNASNLPGYPALRPVGITSGIDTEEVWASIHQSTLGQIGFRLDSRVYGVSVAVDPDWSKRFGGAIFADSLCGSGDLCGTRPSIGAEWQVTEGVFLRSENGLTVDSSGTALLELSESCGLIRLHVAFTDDTEATVGIRWRVQDAQNHYFLELKQGGAHLGICEDGRSRILASSDKPLPRETDIQILDSGSSVGAYANGISLFERLPDDRSFQEAVGLGLEMKGGPADVTVADFEVHPRSIALPDALDHGAPWTREGSQIIVGDDFSGSAGDLEGTSTTLGGKKWRRLAGDGHFQRTGDGAVAVVATRDEPCPGRTMYGIDWDNEDFVDVEVTITPPGTARGQRQNGISGIVVWQDEDNYMTINSWVSDGYDGASISCFFNIRGWEDVYDAIWSNVGARIQHGVPYRMRVIADSTQYMVRVDDEPVVYRAFRDVYSDCEPLRIRSVGLITNWEWGLDTGSVFRDFNVRL